MGPKVHSRISSEAREGVVGGTRGDEEEEEDLPEEGGQGGISFQGEQDVGNCFSAFNGGLWGMENNARFLGGMDLCIRITIGIIGCLHLCREQSMDNE